MKRFDWKYLPIGALLVLSTALAPVFRAQDSLIVTRVHTDPPDAYYTVDGASYTGPSSSAWVAGSKHTLNAVSPQNPPGKLKTQYVWSQWNFGDNILNFNPVVVTTASAAADYVAKFNVFHALSLVFFDCTDPTNCVSPGVIMVAGIAYTSSADIYFGQGSDVILQAFPNPGWVFTGWAPGANQTITGLQNKVHLNAPVSVYPKFQPARKISFATIPDGLQILADRAPIYAPTSLDWAMDTVHSVGPVSPQQDRFGKYWSFQSWSDGGAANHAYKVGSANTPDTLTATYVPAAGVTIVTQPAGLQVKVDGVLNSVVTPLNPFFFTWGVGETHRLEAPAQQTDAQGRVWKFSAWSNGGDEAQDFTVPLDADNGGARVTASYTQLAKLTVTSSVTSLSVQVDGQDCAVPCQVLRNIGEKVRVTAPASISLGDTARLDFNGWPGGASEYVALMGEAAQTLAVSYRAMNRFDATSDPANGAAWRVDPPSGDGFYSADSVVSVSLTAQPGFRFRRWDGDLSGTIPSGVVAMSAPRVVRALLDTVPYIAPAGVGNAAGATPSTAVAPGSVIAIFGANLGNATAAAGDGLLPQTLAGVTARVGEQLLPLVFASPAQINAVLPDDLGTGQQLLVVTPAGQTDVRAAFTVARNAPGLFGTVFHEDGSAVSAEAPAKTGELLTVYGTGFGPADHPRIAGFPIPASPAYLIADPVEVRMDDAAMTLVQVFAVPGKVGIDAVQFRLSDGTGSGALKVVVNGVESNTVATPVQ